MSKKRREQRRRQNRRYYQRHKQRLKERRLLNFSSGEGVAIGDVLGEATTYAELVELLVRRRKELAIPQLELDARAGLQDGYTGKLEIGKERGGRTMGPISTAAWLKGLGVKLVVVRSEDAD